MFNLNNISVLTQENSEVIANEWKYEGIYSFYDMINDREDYEEIVTPQLRKDRYFQIVFNNVLIAFFCISPYKENKVEVGLGLAPLLAGKGLGKYLLKCIEDFLVENYKFDEVLLSVVEFNIRAIKVYKKVGYVEKERKIVKTNGGNYNFIVLTKKLLVKN